MKDSPSQPGAVEETPDGRPEREEGAADPAAKPSAEEAADIAPDTLADAQEPAGNDDTTPTAEQHAAPGERVAELEGELDAVNDRHLRLAAEFNNYRRRTELERLELWGRAQAELLGRLLDVLDDLQRVSGLDAEQTTLEGLMEGIDLVERKFVRVLEDTGAEVLDPSGEKFDPETMDAMMRVPAEHEEEDDIVAQVFQKGYAFKGHLVRPARVSVHKHD